MLLRDTFVLVLSSGVAGAATALAGPLVGLGNLPNGANSTVVDMSSDGSTVLTNAGNAGYFWRGGSWSAIPAAPGILSQRLNGVSGNGLAFVGVQVRPIPFNPNGAFPVKWSAAGGWVDLGGSSDHSLSSRGAMYSNFDGSVSVGDMNNDSSTITQTYGFPAGSTERRYSPFLVTDEHRYRGLSDAGNVAVSSNYGPIQSATLAVRSTSPVTFTTPSIAVMPHNEYSEALALSCDGNVMMAHYEWRSDFAPFSGNRRLRWTNATGFVAIPTSIPGNAPESELSGDGDIWAMSGTIYQHSTGTASPLHAFLTARGADLSGWATTSLFATEVSCDGLTYSGRGTHTLPDGSTRSEAWIVTIPAPASCAIALGALAPLGLCRRRRSA